MMRSGWFLFFSYGRRHGVYIRRRGRFVSMRDHQSKLFAIQQANKALERLDRFDHFSNYLDARL